uniref:Protein kish-B n=1 Tax=Heterorhabditis bacteriophora TaxID=37862 RepID=A0A1I7XQY9_HETBA
MIFLSAYYKTGIMTPDDEDIRKAVKRDLSEKKRLKSLEIKRELIKQRQAVIAHSLKEVDQRKNKIVFSDSESDNDETIVPKTKLFEESLSEGCSEDDEKIVNRHEGKKGEKLMHMQARFNSDSRFTMDDKFVSSSSEDESEQEEMALEKQKNRELLSKVLGKNIKSAKVKTNSSKSSSRPFTRFDPDDEEHVRWLKQSESIEKDIEDENEVVHETKKGIMQPVQPYYEIDTNFAEELKNKLVDDKLTSTSTSDFSFLNSIGRAKAEQCENDDKNAMKEDSIVKSNVEDKKSRAGDSCYNMTMETTEQKTWERKTLSSAFPSKFFLTGDEPSVRSIVSNFRRTQSIDKIALGWSTYRDSIVKQCLLLMISSMLRKFQSFIPLLVVIDWRRFLVELGLLFMNAYSFDGVLVISLLVICSCAYLRRVTRVNNWLLSEKKGFFGIFYKASVIGIRLHSFISISCLVAAFYTVFLR